MKRGQVLKEVFLFFGVFAFLKLRKPARSTKMKLSRKVAIGSGTALVVILLFGWLGFPKLIKSQIKKQVALKPGGEVRQMFVKIPFPLDFKVYIFNVTNPLEVQAGDMPILDQVGPYFYQEWKEKLEVVDNIDDDTMEYNPRDTFIFDQERSGKLTGEEIVTVPHPMIVGMLNTVAAQKPAMLTLASKAINVIFRNPTSIFLTTKVKDLLFDGVIINCTVTDFAAKAVCTQLKTEAKDLKQITPTDFSFSFFGPKNATLGKRFKALRGVKNSHDLGRIVQYDETTEMKVWPVKQCNQYKGTDGTIFPPFLEKEEGLASFAPDLCRSLVATFVEESKYDGIKVNKYSADLGDMSTDKELKCFCPTPDTCLKKGLMDISKCNGNPIIVSLPHFYLADASYLQGVKGLHPEKDKHAIEIFFESFSGSPVCAYKRLQFNIEFHNLKKVPLMKDLREALVPLFWIEESVALNSTYTDQLKILFRVMKIVSVSKWIILVSSLAGLGAAAYLHFKKTAEVDITPVHKVKDSDAQFKQSSVISLVHQNGISNGKENTNSLSGHEFDKY